MTQPKFYLKYVAESWKVIKKKPPMDSSKILVTQSSEVNCEVLHFAHGWQRKVTSLIAFLGRDDGGIARRKTNAKQALPQGKLAKDGL